MPSRYPFYGIEKPPVVLVPRKTTFVCITCGKPGETLSPVTNTHEGECRKVQKRKAQKRTADKLRARRAAARGLRG